MKLLKKIEFFLKIMEKKNKKLCIVESCTGGLLASLITSIPGSSKVLDFGLVTYSNESKILLAKIPRKKIEKFGAVSDEVATLMAKNILKLSPKNYLSISCTGIAGPKGGNKVKPVGTVFVSLCFNDISKTFHKKFYKLDRKKIQLKTSEFMIDEGIKMILNN